MKKINIIVTSSLLSACVATQGVLQETKQTQEQVHNILQEETENTTSTLTDEEMYQIVQQNDYQSALKNIRQFLSDVSSPEMREYFFYEMYDWPLYELELSWRSTHSIADFLRDPKWEQEFSATDMQKMFDFLEEYSLHLQKRIEIREAEEQFLQKYQKEK